jgi:hypothetical protein
MLLARIYRVGGLEATGYEGISKLKQRFLQLPRHTIFAEEPVINIQPASKINPHRSPVADLLALSPCK